MLDEHECRCSWQWIFKVKTAALTFRTKQYSTSYSSHIGYGKRFCYDFFLNHNTIALVHNCLKRLNCVVNTGELFFSFVISMVCFTVLFC